MRLGDIFGMGMPVTDIMFALRKTRVDDPLRGFFAERE